MNRLRTPLLILGLVGALVVAVAVFLVIRLGRGVPVQLPVAIQDITPGTLLDPQLFRIEQVRGMNAQTLDSYVTADEFAQYLDAPVTEMVHAGFPVGKAQIQTDTPNTHQSRLTLLLSDPAHLVYPLPVTADQVGNFVVPGDRVDVILTLGRVASSEMSHTEWVEGPDLSTSSLVTTTLSVTPVIRLDQPITTTLTLPVAKVILSDLLVLRVEREQARAASTSYGLGTEQSAPTPTEGDVLRLYLEVDQEQAEMLSFALHNGALTLSTRAAEAGETSEGFVWEDFVDAFFAGRDEEE